MRRNNTIRSLHSVKLTFYCIIELLLYRLQWRHNYTKKDETKQHYQIPPFSKLYTSQLQDKKVQSNNRWIDKITRNSYTASAAYSACRLQVLY